MAATVTAMLCLASLPILVGKGGVQGVLYTAAALLAWTSSTVVGSLNALTSLKADELAEASGGDKEERGRVMGEHRSRGQLGRAGGPIFG